MKSEKLELYYFACFHHNTVNVGELMVVLNYWIWLPGGFPGNKETTKLHPWKYTLPLLYLSYVPFSTLFSLSLLFPLGGPPLLITGWYPAQATSSMMTIES